MRRNVIHSSATARNPISCKAVALRRPNAVGVGATPQGLFRLKSIFGSLKPFCDRKRFQSPSPQITSPPIASQTNSSSKKCKYFFDFILFYSIKIKLQYVCLELWRKRCKSTKRISFCLLTTSQYPKICKFFFPNSKKFSCPFPFLSNSSKTSISLPLILFYPIKIKLQYVCLELWRKRCKSTKRISFCLLTTSQYPKICKFFFPNSKKFSCPFPFLSNSSKTSISLPLILFYPIKIKLQYVCLELWRKRCKSTKKISFYLLTTSQYPKICKFFFLPQNKKCI